MFEVHCGTYRVRTLFTTFPGWFSFFPFWPMRRMSIHRSRHISSVVLHKSFFSLPSTTWWCSCFTFVSHWRQFYVCSSSITPLWLLTVCVLAMLSVVVAVYFFFAMIHIPALRREGRDDDESKMKRMMTQVRVEFRSKRICYGTAAWRGRNNMKKEKKCVTTLTSSWVENSI